MQNTSTTWKNLKTRQFAEVLAYINDVATMQSFLRDVMTEKEILEMSARLEAARMLQSGATYTDVIENTKLSSRTVARISEWLKNGNGGYAAALQAINAHHTHIPPARTE